MCTSIKKKRVSYCFGSFNPLFNVKDLLVSRQQIIHVNLKFCIFLFFLNGTDSYSR